MRYGDLVYGSSKCREVFSGSKDWVKVSFFVWSYSFPDSASDETSDSSY